jgi:hypothetical protein
MLISGLFLPCGAAMSRLDPLPEDAHPELNQAFDTYRRALGFVPNSVLIMQRKPRLVAALAELAGAVWHPDGDVDRGFKRLLAHVASKAHGCHY